MHLRQGREAEQIQQRRREIEFAHERVVADARCHSWRANDEWRAQSKIVERHLAVRKRRAVIAEIYDDGVRLLAGSAQCRQAAADLSIRLLNRREILRPILTDHRRAGEEGGQLHF